MVPTNKTINLIGDVCEDMLESLVEKLERIENIRSRGKEVELNINLCTDGGDAAIGIAIYYILKRLDYSVAITVLGKCYSAGTIILQGAKIRRALPESKFLIHYGCEFNDSTGSKKNNEELNKAIINIINDNVTASKRTVTKWFDSETYMDATVAVKKGLIDEIEAD